MDVVFDCSAIMSCLAPDEAPPARWRKLLSEADLIAPPLLPTELANALQMARRRKRLSETEVLRAIATVKILAVHCEPPLMARSLEDVRSLAAEHGLTAYDASYLELAVRRGLPLATLDGALSAAAKKAKIKLL